MKEKDSDAMTSVVIYIAGMPAHFLAHLNVIGWRNAHGAIQYGFSILGERESPLSVSYDAMLRKLNSKGKGLLPR